MKIIIPVVKPNQEETFLPIKALKCPVICIRAQELIRKDGSLNNFFNKIKNSGGLHSYFNYNGRIILSFIMKDRLLENLNVETYVELMKGLKPDYWITPDCESYDLERSHSKKQILAAYEKTKKLISLCKPAIPMGLVKGADEEQISWHYKKLRELGIRIFIIHSGDFFRNGQPDKIKKVKHYAHLIKNQDNLVFLFGFGSQKRLEEFSFVDGMITLNHFVTALNGMIFLGRKKYRYSNKHYVDVAIHNLKQMHINLLDSKKQTKLTGVRKKWVGAAEQYPELIIQK